MAYVPPHKRISKEKKDERPSPTPYMYDQLQDQKNLKHSFHLEKRKDKGIQQRQPISKWFIVPSIEANHDHEEQLPSSYPMKFIQWKLGQELYFLVSDSHPAKGLNDDGNDDEHRSGQKPVILVCDYYPCKEIEKLNIESVDEIVNSFPRSPWMSIIKEIQRDLIASFQNLRSEMCLNVSKLTIKPAFVVKIGKNLLHGINLKTIRESSVQTSLRQLNRSFITNIPDWHVGAILDEIIPKIGVEFYAEKEYYHVKVFDRHRQHDNITCKCSVINAVGGLELCKIELNQGRHLIIDISYLDKNQDLRLMLSTKRIFTTPTDDGMHCLRKLIKSATIDSEMTGGIRWPSENDSLANRYDVIGVWHTKSRAFKNPLMRLKIRHVDGFNFRTSTGKLRQEVALEMTEIDRNLRDASMELGPVIGMIDDTIKMMWEHLQ